MADALHLKACTCISVAGNDVHFPSYRSTEHLFDINVNYIKLDCSAAINTVQY